MFQAQVMDELRQEDEAHKEREVMLEQRRRQDAKIIERKMNERLHKAK